MTSWRRQSSPWVAALMAAVTAVSLRARQERPARGLDASATTVGSLRARGLELGYNLDYREALADFSSAATADPDDPAPERLAAATVWMMILFAQGAVTVDDYLGETRANLERPIPDPALDALFHDHLSRAISLSERRLADDPEGADAHFQAGAAYGVLASYTATVEGHMIGSLGPARRAYREHERVLELDPSRRDACLLVGLYRCAVAELSTPMRLVAHLLGFGGDRDRGASLVDEASRYPSDSQASALFMRVLLDNRSDRYDDAIGVIETLRMRYPRNRLLWLEEGNTELKAGRPERARAALELGLAQCAADARPRAAGEESRWRLAYGSSLVALRDITAADRELRAALADATRAWVRGHVHRELGKLADLEGARPRALDEYRIAARLCRDDHDSTCVADVNGLLRVPYR